jgi:hypothetical protein
MLAETHDWFTEGFDTTVEHLYWNASGHDTAPHTNASPLAATLSGMQGRTGWPDGHLQAQDNR